MWLYMATLYLVGTPIGNLEDITLRALRTLEEVDIVVCEDTRVTKKLLDRHELKCKKLISFHSQSSDQRLCEIIRLLEEGNDLAYVTDSGTPGLSDPGARLVAGVYKHFGEEVKVVPIPGATALAAMASVGGLPVSDFLFLGFLPHKKGRQTLIKEIEKSGRTVILYESPHRIQKLLHELVEGIAEDRQVTVGRELTKIYEEIVRGSVIDVEQYFLKNTDKVRGEFVVMIAGSK